MEPPNVILTICAPYCGWWVEGRVEVLVGGGWEGAGGECCNYLS